MHLRCGDSLVGLTRDQIVAFHWLPSREKDFITRSLLQTKLDEAERLRAEIRDAGDETDVATLGHLLQEADEALDDLRLAGDLVVLAFFSGRSERERQGQRDRLAQQVWSWQQGGDADPMRAFVDDMRAEAHVVPFHWQIEFPEVFDRNDPGSTCIIGNPPFMAGKNITGHFGQQLPRLAEAIVLERWTERQTWSPISFVVRSSSFAKEGLWADRYKHDCTGGYTDCLSCCLSCAHGGSIFNATKRLEWPGRRRCDC